MTGPEATFIKTILMCLRMLYLLVSEKNLVIDVIEELK
jgi:hypothetical protein